MLCRVRLTARTHACTHARTNARTKHPAHSSQSLRPLRGCGIGADATCSAVRARTGIERALHACMMDSGEANESPCGRARTDNDDNETRRDDNDEAKDHTLCCIKYCIHIQCSAEN